MHTIVNNVTNDTNVSIENYRKLLKTIENYRKLLKNTSTTDIWHNFSILTLVSIFFDTNVSIDSNVSIVISDTCNLNNGHNDGWVHCTWTNK